MPIDAPVGGGQARIDEFIDGLVQDETTRIGVMPAVATPGRRMEGLRQVGTGGARVDHRREHPGEDAAREPGRVGDGVQPGRVQGGDGRLFGGDGLVRAVAHADRRVLHEVAHGRRQRTIGILPIRLESSLRADETSDDAEATSAAAAFPAPGAGSSSAGPASATAPSSATTEGHDGHQRARHAILHGRNRLSAISRSRWRASRGSRRPGSAPGRPAPPRPCARCPSTAGAPPDR